MSKPLPKPKKKPPQSIANCVKEVTATYEVVSGRSGKKELAERKAINFNRPLFARMLATSERNLASIEAGKAASPAVTKSIVEIRRLLDALRELFDEATIGQWLKTKNEAFEGRKPLEVIEHGEVDRIWQMIYELRSGATL